MAEHNEVSVFRQFLTRYFGICQFFLRYWGIGYPQMSPSKICGGKIYSITSTFGAKVHRLNVRVKRWHNRYEILN